MKMLRPAQQRVVWISAAAMALVSQSAFAQTATLNLKTSTFANSPTAQIKFRVTGAVEGGNATTLGVEISPDGNATGPLAADPLATPQNVNFTLTLAGQTPQTFTALQAQGAAGITKTVSTKSILGKRSAANLGLYAITITHNATIPVNTSEDWTLDISGLPAAPVLRGVVFIDTGNFIPAMLPTPAPCGAGTPQPCPGVCGPGESCQPWKFRLRELFYIVELKWPPIPPECLRCPGPWKGPVPDGFDRSLVSVFPITQAGELLGPGKAGEITLNIRGAEAVGELFDAGGGQYFQLVQFRKGAAPTVSATAAGVTSAEVVAGPPGGGGSRLSLVLGVLLVLALIVIGYLLTQRGRTNVARA